jgi:hypothetical protein
MTEDETAVVAAELRRCEAMNARDWSALEALLHDDFSYAHTTGVVEARDPYLVGLKGRRLSISDRSVAVRVFGDVAVMSGTGVFSLDVSDRAESAGTLVRVTPQQTLQTWVRIDEHWELFAFQGTAIRGS